MMIAIKKHWEHGMDNAIGAIDWPKLIEAAASSPLGMVALVTILVSVIGYFMLRGASEHYRFIAFVMLFGGGVSLSMSVIDEKDFARRPVAKAKAESIDVPVEVSPKAINQLASAKLVGSEATVQNWPASMGAKPVEQDKNVGQQTPSISKAKQVDLSHLIANLEDRSKSNKDVIKVDFSDKKKNLVRKRVKRIRYKNQTCQGSRDKTWLVKARPGWAILPDSVNVKIALKSKKSHITEIKYVDKTSVKVSAKVVNSGKCRRVLGLNLKDRPGRMVLYVMFKETKLQI